MIKLEIKNFITLKAFIDKYIIASGFYLGFRA